MSDFDDRGRRIPNYDELRDAYLERRARYDGCRCGNPDWPGMCPGWQNCPNNAPEEDE